jgi:DNA repair protein SbcC/Rad50
MEGFGTYPEREIIDFDKYTSDGIFVITGKTGAGKTTILDAITFALFGTVPRYGSSIATDERVRSDYIANTDKPTEVVVEFSQGDHRYRVSRTPTWLPPNKKSEKQTWAQIEEIHPDGTLTVLETRKIREVNTKVDEIVRLNAAQFTQVVLRAQGEFQKFLIADSNERRELLRKLFNTGRFLDYSKDLDGRAAELRNQLALTGASLKTNIASLAAETDVLAPSGLESSGSATLLGWAEPLLDAKQQALTEATSAASTAKAQLDAAAATLAAVEKVAERQKRRDTALADQANLAAREESIRVEAEKLDAARRADIVWPTIESTSRAQKALKTAREVHAGALAAFSEAAPDNSTESEAVKAFASVLTGDVAKLIEVLEREAALPALNKTAADAEANVLAIATTVAALEREEKERKAQLSEVDKKMEMLGPVAKGLSQAEKSLAALIPQLEAAEETEALADELATTTESTKLAISDADAAVGALEAKVKRAKAEQKSRASKAGELDDIAKTIPAAQKELDAADLRLTAAREVDKLTAELGEAKMERRTRASTVEEVANARAALLSKQRAEYAGELATELQSGEPCAVCGSFSHPAPAVRSVDHVTEDDVSAAESAVAKAEAAYNKASSKVAEIQALLHVQQKASKGEAIVTLSRILAEKTTVRDNAVSASVELDALNAERREFDEAIDQLATDLAEAKESHNGVSSEAKATLADLEARIKIAKKRVAGESTDALRKAVVEMTKTRDGAAEAADQLESLSAERKVLVATIDGLATALVTARETVGTGKAAAKEASSESAKETKAVDKARGEYPTVAARTRAIEVVLSLANSMISASADLEQKAAVESEAKRALKVTLGEQGFDTWTSCQGARLPKEEQAELSARIDEHVADTATATKILAEPELSDLPDEVMDVATPRADREAADGAHDASMDRRGQAQKSHGTVKRLVDEIRMELSSSGDAQKEFELVDGLASVVRGQGSNEKRMTLETFALAADLEEIVAHANVRLGGMTSNRFKLEYSDELAKGKGQSGLALNVVDAYNDETRPPESLSGGEKFQASLALALGLADVVTSRNGGVRLDTLFIDEGFGALDPDTLNDVMDAIDDLRGGGRTVGLISHVEQVKDRIPNHIEVEITEDGWSRIR